MDSGVHEEVRRNANQCEKENSGSGEYKNRKEIAWTHILQTSSHGQRFNRYLFRRHNQPDRIVYEHSIRFLGHKQRTKGQDERQKRAATVPLQGGAGCARFCRDRYSGNGALHETEPASSRALRLIAFRAPPGPSIKHDVRTISHFPGPKKSAMITNDELRTKLERPSFRSRCSSFRGLHEQYIGPVLDTEPWPAKIKLSKTNRK